MDEFLDKIFSSSSWSDVNAAADRSSWGRNSFTQNDGLQIDHLGMFDGGDNNLPMHMPPSSHAMDKLATSYGFPKDLLIIDEPQPLGDVFNQDTPYRAELVNSGNMNSNYTSMQSNMCPSTLGSLSHSSPELVPGVSGSAQSPRGLPESGSVGSNDSETSGIHPSIGESHSFTSIPQLWASPSYGGVPSLSPVIEQDKLHGFGLQGDFVETDANVFGNRYLSDDKNVNVRNFNSSASPQEELLGLPSFTANQGIPVTRTHGQHSQMQLPQLSEGNPTAHLTDQNPVSQLPHSSVTPGGGCNGGIKPRIRARRGQATDPHSIAERLRREKIADRMKNLQELVPNASRADKSSMLDEIIEYVKFLQLQVKVLSMSRLGAAGAVVPLITESETEGSGNLLLSPSTGQEGDHSDSQDNAAFEEELVKLMESNVTAAMQYLQTKGLCLMPIALAGAISSKKEASSPDSSERKMPYFTNGHLPPHNNSPPCSNPNGHNSFPNGNTMLTENMICSLKRQDTVNNGFNRDVVKQEDAANSRVLKNKD
ncbi:hypothetical protein MKW94_030081 [Papaver nudicaule]|uniref:BHLH domain-containing protein n=1 Tax=Papaver nudicaule TaxID=74823 RepID=A0AA41S2G4_PAPNU|nr:hypothetical protein [Papaver nudicaule]